MSVCVICRNSKKEAGVDRKVDGALEVAVEMWVVVAVLAGRKPCRLSMPDKCSIAHSSWSRYCRTTSSRSQSRHHQGYHCCMPMVALPDSAAGAVMEAGAGIGFCHLDVV